MKGCAGALSACVDSTAFERELALTLIFHLAEHAEIAMIRTSAVALVGAELMRFHIVRDPRKSKSTWSRPLCGSNLPRLARLYATLPGGKTNRPSHAAANAPMPQPEPAVVKGINELQGRAADQLISSLKKHSIKHRHGVACSGAIALAVRRKDPRALRRPWPSLRPRTCRFEIALRSSRLLVSRSSWAAVSALLELLAARATSPSDRWRSKFWEVRFRRHRGGDLARWVAP